MTVKDVVRNTDVIACTNILNSVSANILFDSGATKVFHISIFCLQIETKDRTINGTITSRNSKPKSNSCESSMPKL